MTQTNAGLDDYQKMTLALHARGVIEAQASTSIVSIARAFAHATRDLVGIVGEAAVLEHPITTLYLSLLQSDHLVRVSDESRAKAAKACQELADGYAELAKTAVTSKTFP